MDVDINHLTEVLRRAAEMAKGNGEKLDPLDEELDKILKRSRDTQEEVRKRIKDLTALEQKIENRQVVLAEKTTAREAAQNLAVGCIPQTDRVILPARGQELSSPSQGRRHHGPLVAIPGAQISSRRHIPKVQRRV